MQSARRHPGCRLETSEEGKAMKRTMVLVGFAVISCTTWAVAQAPSQQAAPAPATEHSRSTADAPFIKQAAMGGMAEVEMGQLASSKATNDKVKSFAQRM